MNLVKLKKENMENSRLVKDARLLQSVLVLVHVPYSNGSVTPTGRQKPFLITPPAAEHLRTPQSGENRIQVRRHQDLLKLHRNCFRRVFLLVELIFLIRFLTGGVLCPGEPPA